MPVLLIREIQRKGAVPLAQPMEEDKREKYERALALLANVAAKTTGFSTYKEKLDNGVSSIIGFVEAREECLRNIRRRVDEHLSQIRGSLTRPAALNGNTKQRILENMNQLLENAFYQMQYHIAGIEMPEEHPQTMVRIAAFSEPRVFRPNGQINQKLAAFLASIGVGNRDFMDAVETIRDSLLPVSDKQDEWNACKLRLKEIATAIASAYIDFHLTGQPMIEGLQR
ncbi:hypothetical protein J4450_04895 [Candidatus Micrarchaeota archaeon]|nr:hypothetical protein [Candidatus Micrarchaeota archaeon]